MAINSYNPVQIRLTGLAGCEQVARVVNVHSRAWENTPESERVYIGRDAFGWEDTGWGNPFRIGRDGDREQVIVKHAVWLLESSVMLARLPELRGKVLGCWCCPDKCHGETLVQLANMPGESLRLMMSLIDGKRP